MWHSRYGRSCLAPCPHPLAIHYSLLSRQTPAARCLKGPSRKAPLTRKQALSMRGEGLKVQELTPPQGLSTNEGWEWTDSHPSLFVSLVEWLWGMLHTILQNWRSVTYNSKALMSSSLYWFLSLPCLILPLFYQCFMGRLPNKLLVAISCLEVCLWGTPC